MSKNKQRKKKTSIKSSSILAQLLMSRSFKKKLDKERRRRRLYEQIKEQSADQGIILTNSQIQQGLESLHPEKRHHPSHLVYALTDIKEESRRLAATRKNKTKQNGGKTTRKRKTKRKTKRKRKRKRKTKRKRKRKR